MCSEDPKGEFRRLHDTPTVFPHPAQEPAAPCETKVRENAAALRSIGRYAFPTIIMPDGFRIVGANEGKVFGYLNALADADPEFRPRNTP